MRKKINSNNIIAEENINLTGHPASEKFDSWGTTLTEHEEGIHEKKKSKKKETKAAREKKIRQIDEVIEEDLDRL